MKKIISMFLTCLILVSTVCTVSAESPTWQEVFKKVIDGSPLSSFLLMDVSGDGIPELFCSSGSGVASYYFDGNGAQHPCCVCH